MMSSMLKLKLIAATAVLTAFSITPALAGNGAPSGAHYNLNIIGVEKNKTADMTSSNRHTVFVELNNAEGTHSNIYLTRGDFQVCDGNAFDAAYDCSGNKIGTTGAVFQLPCNTNLSGTSGGQAVDVIACTEGQSAAYTVWSRALGKPGGSATMTTCATETKDYDGDGVLEEYCSTENVVMVRNNGRSTFKNVTNELTSLVAQLDDDVQLERVALFAGDFEDWMWQYANKGLRLAQLRFYLQ